MIIVVSGEAPFASECTTINLSIMFHLIPALCNYIRVFIKPALAAWILFLFFRGIEPINFFQNCIHFTNKYARYARVCSVGW